MRLTRITSRMRFRPDVRSGKLFGLVGLIIALLFLIQASFTAVATVLTHGANQIPGLVLSLCYRQDPARVLCSAVPVLQRSGFAGDSKKGLFSGGVLAAVGAVVQVDLSNPTAVLKSQLPVSAALSAPAQVLAVSRSAANRPAEKSLPGVTSLLPEAIQVIIINTHTGETYSMTDQRDRLERGQGGIVTVAAALQAALENNYGISTARSDRIHDINYDEAYTESRKTVEELLTLSPEAEIVLDIHRDAGKTREQSLVTINGEEIAQLLFIVGLRDTANFTFAKQLSTNINEIYPGLSLGVRVKNGDYNLQLHPRMVLVEIGTSNNTLEEAVRSATLLADVIAQMINN